MRLFILGATGRTGAQLLRLGSERGHQLTAFVRSPHKLVDRPDGLQVVTGDPLDPVPLAVALAGHDAVLSALGPPPRIRESQVDWTIARPPRLVDSGPDHYASRSGELPQGARVMTYRALATFMLDSVEQRSPRQEVVGLGPQRQAGQLAGAVT